MKLSITYAWEDRLTARKISRLCRSLELACVMEERKDWLRFGFRGLPPAVTHLILVYSPACTGSWWLPFLLGRARDEQVPVLLYWPGPRGELPAFLRGADAVDDLDSLGHRLRVFAEAAFSRLDQGRTGIGSPG